MTVLELALGFGLGQLGYKIAQLIIDQGILIPLQIRHQKKLREVAQKAVEQGIAIGEAKARMAAGGSPPLAGPSGMPIVRYDKPDSKGKIGGQYL